MRPSRAALVLAAAAFLLGCGDDGSATAPSPSSPTSSSAPTTETTETTTAPTTAAADEPFSGAVLPIIESTCARCHTGDGPGTAHLRLDTVGHAIENRQLMAAAVSTEYMPPWPASDESVPFADDWSLTDEQREALLDWTAHPLVDVPDDTPIVASGQSPLLDEATMELVPPVGYAGVAGQPDMYRCFVYDPGFTSESWIRGFEFRPDRSEVVHHAIGYLVGADLLDDALARDAEHPDQGGWPCFGGSGLGAGGIFLGWAPGQGATRLPAGSALRMDPGQFVVVQVHYHFEVDAPPDQSALLLDVAGPDEGPFDPVDVIEFVAPAEIPCSAGEEGPLCDRDAALARAVEKYGDEGVLADETLFVCRAEVADFVHMTDGVASSSCDLPARAAGTLVSVLGHEHELGASFRMTLHPDTADEVVLLDIPDWTFDWQLNYYPVEEFEISPRDMVRIECSWDRARRDPDLEPAYVLWADGTDDEMCFATMVVRLDGE